MMIKMWEKINEKFKKYPARMKVAEKMIELGLSLNNDGKIYCGNLKISDKALAIAADVDRRAIKSTIEIIQNDEDQFYFSFTYNILRYKPTGIKQNKFAPSFSGGFLRDMPINKRRNFSIAAGLGYSINNYNYNLLIDKSAEKLRYFPNDTIAFDKNKLILHYIDLPIEIRWRTSRPESHIFWRIYGGVKLSYLVFDRQKFQNDNMKYTVSKNADLNKFQVGTYMAIGNNTWNVVAYYGLTPLYKSAESNGEPVDLQTLNIGLMFYIL